MSRIKANGEEDEDVIGKGENTPWGSGLQA
jgi:hypothetical protein